MPVPATIADLNTTAALNSPAGTETAKGSIDNYLRQHASFIASLRDGGATFQQAGTGAAVRASLAKQQERVSVRDFGAVGDASADDTTAVQNAANYAQLVRGCLVFPPCNAGAYYKITSTITITSPISIRGDSANGVLLYGFGMSAGQYILDYNCVAANVVEHIELSHLVIRSNNALPTALRLKNVSYVESKGLRVYNVAYGIDIEGTRCFTHNYDGFTAYQVTNSCVRWIAGFTGGGQFNFIGATFAGATAVSLPSTSVTDGLSLVACNWEQCTGPGLFLAGTCMGVSIVGGRTEGGDTNDFVFKPFLSSEYIGGISIHGVSFSASDNGAAHRIVMGGDSGKVRGFAVTGNAVGHGADSFTGSLVQLNGDGESGVISGNFMRGTTCTATSSTRAGVVVFGNENLTGKLPETWGTATWGVDQGTWTPIDGSGASLAFTAASGRYTKVGRIVFWQAFVLYPTTANAAAAEVGGLPYPVGGLTGNSEGRAGGRVDSTNLGSAVGFLQGLSSNNEIAFCNPTTNATLTNATLSGKYFYMSGTYSL